MVGANNREGSGCNIPLAVLVVGAEVLAALAELHSLLRLSVVTNKGKGNAHDRAS